MKRTSRKAVTWLCCCMLLLTTSMVAHAATTEFMLVLPANQGDCESDPVKKSSDDGTWFVHTFFMPNEYTDMICAWTESPLGINYSSTYIQIGNGDFTMDYDLSTPAIGDNVVLNMDNPVATSESMIVYGSWSPN